jgi:hypothetical protein
MRMKKRSGCALMQAGPGVGELKTSRGRLPRDARHLSSDLSRIANHGMG